MNIEDFRREWGGLIFRGCWVAFSLGVAIWIMIWWK
jgi:hypothetical protein